MKKLMIVVAALFAAACTTTAPQPSTPKQNYASACLHQGQCDGRPFPSTRAVMGEPWRSVDEGHGADGGDGK